MKRATIDALSPIAQAVDRSSASDETQTDEVSLGEEAHPSITLTPTIENVIVLQVGNRQFTTLRDSLTVKSEFFHSLLSGRWEHNRQKDGSFFIDANEDVFEHILDYLRRGVFPLFYDGSKGHDFAKYLSVLEEARYFQIEPLQKWLEEKRYLEVVKIRHSLIKETAVRKEWKQDIGGHETLEMRWEKDAEPIERCNVHDTVVVGVCDHKCKRKLKKAIEMLLLRKTVIFEGDMCKEELVHEAS